MRKINILLSSRLRLAAAARQAVLLAGRSLLLASVGWCLLSSANAASKLGTPAPETSLIEQAIPSRLAEKTLLLGAATANGRLVAVGQWGHILLSDDKGATWRQAKSVPSRTILNAVYFADDKNGWAVGHDTVILHTADGGETWDQQYSDPPSETPLLTVWFENAQHGLASGAFSMVLETFDGGKSWTKRPLLAVSPEELDEPHFNQMFWGPDRKTQVMLAAEAGHFYRSLDAGKTWEAVPVPYEGSIWGGMTTAQGKVLALGMRGHLFASVDLGTTWAQVETGTDQSLTGGVQLANGDIVVVGLGGAVLRSQDFGATFTAAIRPTRTGQAAVAEAPAGEVIIFGEAGVEHYPLNAKAAATVE